MHALMPPSARFGVLDNPTGANAGTFVREVQAAAVGLGRDVEVLLAASNRDIDAAFAGGLAQKRIDALLVAPNPLFGNRAVQLVTLAAYHRVPALYSGREMVMAGGLMSYGSSQADLARQVGIYVGRILKGAKPADLPVQLATKFEFVINLQTARTFGIEIPPTLLALTDEVIE
jgi:putative ABC transport system substrate-binding protein